MAFRRKETTHEKLRRVIIDPSDTISVGEAVFRRTAGYLLVGTAGTALFGIVVDIQDKNGNSVFGSLANLGSATVTGSADSGSVTVAATNDTVDQIAALVDVSKDTLYSVSVTGTIGTTNTSDIGGGWMDLATGALTVDETTHTRTITNGGTFYNWGKDPDDSTRLIVSIVESEVYGPDIALA